MRDRTSWLQWVGGVWILGGIAGLAWSAISVLVFSFTQGLPSEPPAAVSALSQALYIRLWAQIVVAMAGFAMMVVGWGLVLRRSWVQTLVVPAHLLFAIYAIVGWIAYWVQGLSTTWAGGSALFATLIVLNGGMALWMSSVSSTEALSWLPLRTAAIVPLKCEFCGAPLDPDTKLCPECRSLPEMVHKHISVAPPRARLISLSDEVTFWIEPARKTLIGRGLSANDVNLSNPTVSRQHAQIAYEEGHYVLAALHDSNGTFVNDALIRQRMLQDGDEVRFGRARFQFRIVDSERMDAS
jgi:hypothetical protein